MFSPAVSEKTPRSTATDVESLKAAGRALLERHGELDFNMRELMQLAGVSNRAFYRHFATKQALIATLAEEVYTTMEAALDVAIAGADSPVEQMQAWVDAALVFAHDPGHATRGRVFVAYEARLREDHPALYRRAGRALTGQVTAILQRGLDDGSFSAPVSQARFIVRLVVATLQHHVLDRTTPSDEEQAALAAFVIGSCR